MLRSHWSIRWIIKVEYLQVFRIFTDHHHWLWTDRSSTAKVLMQETGRCFTERLRLCETTCGLIDGTDKRTDHTGTVNRCHVLVHRESLNRIYTRTILFLIVHWRLQIRCEDWKSIPQADHSSHEHVIRPVTLMETCLEIKTIILLKQEAKNGIVCRTTLSLKRSKSAWDHVQRNCWQITNNHLSSVHVFSHAWSIYETQTQTTPMTYDLTWVQRLLSWFSVCYRSTYDLWPLSLISVRTNCPWILWNVQ